MYAEIPEKNVDNLDRIEEGKIYDIRKFLVFPRKYVLDQWKAIQWSSLQSAHRL